MSGLIFILTLFGHQAFAGDAATVKGKAANSYDARADFAPEFGCGQAMSDNIKGTFGGFQAQVRKLSQNFLIFEGNDHFYTLAPRTGAKRYELKPMHSIPGGDYAIELPDPDTKKQVGIIYGPIASGGASINVVSADDSSMWQKPDAAPDDLAASKKEIDASLSKGLERTISSAKNLTDELLDHQHYQFTINDIQASLQKIDCACNRVPAMSDAIKKFRDEIEKIKDKKGEQLYSLGTCEVAVR